MIPLSQITPVHMQIVSLLQYELGDNKVDIQLK